MHSDLFSPYQYVWMAQKPLIRALRCRWILSHKLADLFGNVVSTNLGRAMWHLPRALQRLGSGHKSNGDWLFLFFNVRSAPCAAKKHAMEALLFFSDPGIPNPIRSFRIEKEHQHNHECPKRLLRKRIVKDWHNPKFRKTAHSVNLARLQILMCLNYDICLRVCWSQMGLFSRRRSYRT